MKKTTKYLLMCFLLSLMLAGSQKAFAQTDTEFWFAAPKVAEGSIYGSTGFNTPILLRISTLNAASMVTVTQPANPAFVPRVVNIAANAAATVDLTANIATIQNEPADNVNNWGLKITATTPITVYYEVASLGCIGCNPEMFSLKGNNALGTSFYTPFQNVLNNGTEYVPTPYSAFDIVATQDNTTVTITPTRNIVGHLAGIPFQVTLNTGQTYSAQATSQLAADHLGGSKVTSDKPIAITIKDDLARGGALYGGDCDDLIGDQVVPESKYGFNYAVVRGYLSPVNPEKAFIVAAQDNTTINVAGTNMATINAGQTYVADITQPSTYITSTKPTILLHMSGFDCETAGAILPPLDCNGAASGSPQVAFVRSSNQPFFANILVRTTLINNFLFNGAAGVITAADFSAVPNTNGAYSFARIALSLAQLPAGNSGLINNTAGVFQLGIIHGGVDPATNLNSGVRYAYFSDFISCQNLPLSSTVTTTGIKCFGETNGTATFTVSGGSVPYTINSIGTNTFSAVLTTNPQTFTGLAPGSSSYTITDGIGNVTLAKTYTIGTIGSVLSATISQVQNVDCFANSNGSATVTPTGGTAPYTITGTDIPAPGVIVTAGNSATFTNLAAKTYDYTITDANGCSIMRSVTILKPAVLDASVNTTATCGSLVIIPSGGTAPFKIKGTGIVGEIVLPAGGLTVNNLLAGAYSFIITDANNCTVTKTGTFSNPCPTTTPCTFGVGTTYYGGFESTNNFPTGSGNDLFLGLPRNGSYQVVQNISQAGGGGYLNLGPRNGSGKFMLVHTSSNPQHRLWFARVTVVPGQTYQFCAWIANMKTNPVNGFVINLTANGNSIATKTAKYGWSQICGTYKVPAGVTSVEFAVKDPLPSVGASHFLGLDDICLTPTTTSAPTPGNVINNKQCYVSSTKPGTVNAKSEWVLNDNNTVTIRTTLAKTFTDNVYGTSATTAMGWSKGHKFSDIVSSDMLQLALFDGSGVKKMEVKIDYLSATPVSAAYPSGFRSLGVSGGDGSVVLGNATAVTNAVTSLDENLNSYGAAYAALTVNSPLTTALYADNAQFPAWDYDVWYEITVNLSVFGTQGFGYPSVSNLHSSPSKTGSDNERVVITPCGTTARTVSDTGTTLTLQPAAEPQKAVELVPEKLTASVMPNPTRSEFTIQFRAEDQTPVRMRLMDVSGRLIRTFSNLPSNHTFSFGNDLKKGTYFAEIIQGEERRIIKLVKM